MRSRDLRLQAAALRLAAERVDRGEALPPDLAEALANDMAKHPEDLAAVKARSSPPPMDGGGTRPLRSQDAGRKKTDKP